MPIRPGASVKSKWDMTRSLIGRREEFELVTGTNLVEESQLMVAGGVTHIQATTSVTGGAPFDAVPLGFSMNGKILATTFTNFESGTVPAAPGPYTFQLDHTNLVTNTYTTFADAWVWDTTDNHILQVAGAAVANTSVTLNVATGIITFDANEAGHTFVIRYRWNLTNAESKEILRQSAIGRGSEATFDKVVIAQEHCVFYTTMYDADANWVLNQQTGVPGAGDPVTGAGGVLTIQENNGAGTPFGRIVSLPSASDPYLGVEYSVPAA